MKKRIRHIFSGIKGFSVVLLTLMLFPFARLFLWSKKIWVVSEYGYEARDNGYVFFKYIRENHKEINCYYAISDDSPDFEKVNMLGNIVTFGSLKHFAYFCSARYIVSSKTQGFCPSYYLTLLRQKFHLWGKYIFLQHGITKDNQVFLYKKTAKIDLFICGAKPEFDSIKSCYGYKDNEVVYTGFARFDNYHKLKPTNKILVMPTWRRYNNNDDFCENDYYKTWSSFINSKILNNILLDSGYEMIFYLHPQFKDYAHLFKTNCSNIRVLDFNETNFQQLILESRIYITDFSSLAFDFGYMHKPVIYYQYDEEKYFKSHYIKGYFDYRRDGFGPVVTTEYEVINIIKKYINEDCKIDSMIKKRIDTFFPLYDNKNSERIFLSILSMN